MSLAHLHKRLDYNPVTGVLVWNPVEVSDWKDERWNRRYAGKMAGCISKTLGYYVLRIRGTTYLQHQLVFYMTYGYVPENQIDHINGSRSDNRICNLREATIPQNRMNQKKIRSNNTSGIKGVCLTMSGKRWFAQIRKDGKNYYLGTFDTKEEAANARNIAETEMFGEFSRAI